MQVYKYASINNYASMRVCKYASIQVSKYASMQVIKYASMHVCKYASMQVCMYTNKSEAIYMSAVAAFFKVVKGLKTLKNMSISLITLVIDIAQKAYSTLKKALYNSNFS